MKLVIQIPCYNEEEGLKETLQQIPQSIPGIEEIEIIIIDDGSSDKTEEIAKNFGIKHIVRFSKNRGLAKAFSNGINYSLSLGADIIVNTDADNQYPGREIPKLIEPIISGKADIVIGDRQTYKLGHFSFVKKILERFGSWIVGKLSHTSVPDAVSGFRAYSREAAQRTNVISKYSYTVETLVQAGREKLSIASVPIDVNPTHRKSRLVKSIPSYIQRMTLTIIRAYTMYQPLKVFSYIGVLLLTLGTIIFLRFLYFALLLDESGGHVQSLIFGAAFLIIGFQTLLIGLLSDVVAANRKLIEDVLIQIKKSKSV